MSYPSMDQYQEAVQDPQRAFVDPALQQGKVLANGMGLPLALGGGFALTYTVNAGSRKFAVRCFHKQAAGLQNRYAKIGAALANVGGTNFVGFEYQQSGIRVLGNLYPIVRMDWVNGDTLGVWLDDHHGEKAAVTQLVTWFRDLERFLRARGIAHGDLQNGNVLVVGNSIKLIDYDGLFVPGLAQGQGNEVGHKHFQHPKPAEPEPNRKSGKHPPRLFGQFWMIRRFTSARNVPANAGAEDRNPVGSSHYGCGIVAKNIFRDHRNLRRKRQESGDKRLNVRARISGLPWIASRSS